MILIDVRTKGEYNAGRVVQNKNMDPIEKMKEWQENQYNPGHWTQGRMPHFVFTKKYRKLVLIIFGITLILFVSFSF